MKIRNKANGVEADVPDTLGGVLVSAGGWEKVTDEPVTAPVKAPVKRAPRKAAAKPEAE